MAAKALTLIIISIPMQLQRGLATQRVHHQGAVVSKVLESL